MPDEHPHLQLLAKVLDALEEEAGTACILRLKHYLDADEQAIIDRIWFEKTPDTAIWERRR